MSFASTGLPALNAKPEPKRTGMLGIGRERTRRIHAFHRASFWISLTLTFFVSLSVAMASGSLALTLATAAFVLAFACLASATITDLISMRIPNPLTALAFLPAFLWWAALSLGFDAGDTIGYGRFFYSPAQLSASSGFIVPPVWTGTLFRDIVMSFAGALLIFIPLLGSFILGAMGGGDAKFMPPLALFFGWSMAFDFLLLTFLFGSLVAIPMLIVRRYARYRVAKETDDPVLIRLAGMKTLAYAPAIALSGIVCLAAMLQGIFS